MSYSRLNQNVVQHFTHIHPLTKVDGHGEFTCDGCETYGYGKTYRCVGCDYDLHDRCATCPLTLASFMHPQHQLQLVSKGPKRICDICDELAEGLYYHCEPCDFDVHPLCTQLPQHVRHVPHPAHPLELSNRGASNTCMVCRGAIKSWRYKCGPCRLDVHMECVNTSASPSASASTQQRGFGPQPQFHHYHHQHQQPYYNQYGYDYGHMNQGQVQESRRSTGRRMFGILMTLTVGVVGNIIAVPIIEAMGGFF